jgi:predicted ribosome quality control (RQC) complex YloA/Tae2 family protein
LNPKLSAVENARQYYRRYESAKNASAEVPALVAGVEREIAYLDQLETDLAMAEDERGIGAVEDALAEAGRAPTRRRPRSAPGPRRMLSDDGFVIWVGRNSRQNDELTFRMASARDIWLHAHGIPGAHVVIKAEGREVPTDTILRAARLAGYYSAARDEGKVDVDYTQRRNVRRLRGGRPGQVILRQYETITVTPQP